MRTRSLVAWFLLMSVLSIILGFAATNPPPVVTGFAATGLNWRVELSGRPGKVFELKASTNLMDWETVGVLSPGVSNFAFLRPESGISAQYFGSVLLPGTNPPTWNWSQDYPLMFSPDQMTNLFLQWRPPSDLLEITGYRVYQDDVLVAELAATTLCYAVSGLETGQLYRFRIEAGNEDANWTSNGLALAVRPAPGDPADMATVPGNGIPTSAGDSIRFLFDATNSIQTGADTNDLESYRLSVLRGRVLDAKSNVLEGVAVSIQGEPDYGTTFSRTNGYYDIAVNGGSVIVLDFRCYGLLPVQRTLTMPWQETVEVPDVFFLQPDTNLTVVGFTNPAAMQVAQGPVVSDADGARRAMVLIPTNARASIITYAGETQEVDQLTTRFTEYTEGTTGPGAMPGDLLPSVAYTYCIELGSMEAQDKVAGRDVLFNTNVYFYTDNFLGIPPGIGVPMGYYDNDRGAWVPSRDGIVILLMGTNEQGLARVCANTNGVESDTAELAALEFTDDERRTLAQTYDPATNSLWRVPIQHFSTYDCNYGIVPEEGAEEPQVPPVTGGEVIPHPDVNCGNSGIEVENQVLTEVLPVLGTPYYLVYSSQTAAQNPKFRKMRIPVSGSSLPTNITAIRLTMTVAGKQYQYDLPATTNQTIDFSWDGTDLYGRSVQGAQPVSYSVEYLYPGYYAAPLTMSASFGAASGRAIPGMIRSRASAILRQTVKSTVGTFDAATRGLGGWMLNVHHVYDPINQRVYLGTGRTREGVQLMKRSSETEWITDILLGSNDGDLRAEGLDIGADGSVYVADSSDPRVARIDRFGKVTTIADMPDYIKQLAVGPNQRIYVANTTYFGALQVYRVYPNGRIEVFAGTGHLGPRTPGVRATELNLDCHGITFAPDGTAFIADMWSNVIWRVGMDGIAHIAAGKLAAYGGYDGDGLSATESKLSFPNGLAYDDKSGRVYICDTGNNLVRAITFGGLLQNVAGNGSMVVDGDGGNALDAGVYEPKSIALGKDGSLFIVHRSSDPGNGRLRQILPDGRIITVSGEGSEMPGMGRRATTCQFSKEWTIAVGSDGSIYASDAIADQIYRFRPAIRPLEQSETLLVASEDASEIFVFDLNGRHLQTLDALTGATNLTFTYTTDGFLESVTDANGRTTEVHRNGSGLPTSIEAPGGQTLTFTLDGDNYLETATYPDSGQYQMGYTNTLLSRFESPRGHASTYDYDSSGNLVRYVRVNGSTGTLTRIEAPSGWTVIHTNPVGVVQTYETELTGVGGQWSRTRFACGCGSDSDTYVSPDGLVSNVTTEGDISLTQTGPDPRFGMQAPGVAWSSYTTPGGLLAVVSNVLSAGIPDEQTPQVFTVLTNQSWINERLYLSVFDRNQRLQADTTPMGRIFTVEFDARGRVIQSQSAGQAAVRFGYDANGYLRAITNGTGAEARATTFSVNNQGNLTESVDPESVTTRYDYDAGDRVTNILIASAVRIGYRKDKAGNILTIRSPGDKIHTFTYTADDLLERYYTPTVGGTSNMTHWTYTPLGVSESVIYPDGTREDFTYNAAGKLEEHTYTDGGEYYTYGSVMGGSMLTRIESSNSVILEYSYDGTLLLTERWSGPVTGSVSRGYDNNLWITNLAVNGNEIAGYGYDSDGLVTRAGELLIFRDPESGQVTSTLIGVVQDFSSYNRFGELTNYQVRVNGTNFYRVAWDRDKLGRVTRGLVHDPSGAFTNEYSYDPAGRWIQVATNGAVMRWNFDLDGNITNVTQNGSAMATASYDADDRLVQWGSDTFAFTACGTLSTAVLAGVTNRYRYDPRGVLLAVTRDSGSITNISYVVDGKKRRIARSVNGIQSHAYLYYNSLHPVAVLDNQNRIVQSFTFAVDPDMPACITTTDRVCRVISDLAGTPIFILDTTSGEVIQRTSHTPWGTVLQDSNPGFQPFGFAAGLYDPETGLLRFGVRDYAPAIKRWTAKDPLLFTGSFLNLYAYCGNDPINRRDPFGTREFDSERRRYLQDQIKITQNEFNDAFLERLLPQTENGPGYGNADLNAQAYPEIAPMGDRVHALAMELDRLRNQLDEEERNLGIRKEPWWQSILDSLRGTGGEGGGSAFNNSIAPCAK